MTSPICNPPFGRRALLAGVCTAAAESLLSSPAHATLFRGVPLKELTQLSQRVVIGSALEAASHWEVIGGRRRIVTDTRVLVEEVVAKNAPAQGELLVRTLGGTVGGMAALVFGEASLELGQRSMLFLMSDGSFERITAMAQGHYPLRLEAKDAWRVFASPHTPELVGKLEPAVHLLAGKELGRARMLIQQVVAQ
ncbi:MAG: hypothetical protein SFV15_10100 [Polyangiaceae bacterium]|nr:hypothetical protein [Polyangiaceae bacterium]